MTKDIQAALKYISQGVYIISVNDGEKQNAFTAAWVMQVSFDPLLICFSINPKNYSYQLLKQGQICCISVLAKKQLAYAKHFGCTSGLGKMENHSWFATKSGAPALADSVAYIDCHVDHFSDAGDHELVVCKVVDAAVLNDREPMLYCDTENMDNSSELYE